MTLCDAGPLVALVDPTQAALHERCNRALKQLKAPLITTWPCLTEAFYLAARGGGWPRQAVLWKMLQSPGVLTLHVSSTDEVQRMRELMERYRNVPMDLADASLVAAAEVFRSRTIFTIDSDFLIYRTSDGGAFEMIPGVE